MMVHLHEALSRRIDIREGGRIRKVSVREAIAISITNLALKKGDPKSILFLLGIERDISAIVERSKIDVTKKMTPKEALDAFMALLNSSGKRE